MTEHQRLIEASREARIEGAKDRLRLMQQVLTAFVNGKTTAQTAAGIIMPVSGVPMSRQTAWRYLVVLGLETGRRHSLTGKRTGRRDTKATLMEARP